MLVFKNGQPVAMLAQDFARKQVGVAVKPCSKKIIVVFLVVHLQHH
jgi:hypothetical protein